MRELVNLKVPCLRVRGVQVSIHLLLVVLVAFMVWVAVRAHAGNGWWIALVEIGLLLVVLALHELGHLVLTHHLGGEYEELVLWPFGSLVFPTLHPWGKDEPAAAQDVLAVAVAGPAVNVIACLLALPLLLVWQLPLGSLLNPLRPPLVEGTLVSFIGLFFWLNATFVMANLLPALPLDGGQVLRAVLWKQLGTEAAALWAGHATRATAVVLLLIGILLPDSARDAMVPVVLLAVLMFFSARQEQPREHEPAEQEGFLGYDFSQGYTSLEREPEAPATATEPKLTAFQQWWQQRRVAQLERKTKTEAEEERRFDEILARIHEVGMDGLSREEKKLLHRVSERYRTRLQK